MCYRRENSYTIRDREIAVTEKLHYRREQIGLRDKKERKRLHSRGEKKHNFAIKREKELLSRGEREHTGGTQYQELLL